MTTGGLFECFGSHNIINLNPPLWAKGDRIVEITIIADNGGGLTLQLIDDSGAVYQHWYNDPVQCAQDIKSALEDDGFVGWEGNEAEDSDGNDQWLDPDYDDIRNGGYRVLTLDDLDEDSSWYNIAQLSRAMR